MDRSTTHFLLTNIMYLYEINKISLNEQCVCFITCLNERMFIFFVYVVLNVFKSILWIQHVKVLNAFYVLSKMFRHFTQFWQCRSGMNRLVRKRSLASFGLRSFKRACIEFRRVREVAVCMKLPLSHDMTKRVFGCFQPGQTQTGLCSHRN